MYDPFFRVDFHIILTTTGNKIFREIQVASSYVRSKYEINFYRIIKEKKNYYKELLTAVHNACLE